MSLKRTDVLVIGSGGAGLVAACAAKGSGADVTLLTKSHAGVANSTAYAGGGFTVPRGALTAERHRQMTFEIGRQINVGYMLDALSYEAEEAVRALTEFGVRLDLRDGGASVARYGKSAMMGGSGMTIPLVEHAKAGGVDIIENAMLTGLFIKDGAVTGARVLDTKRGHLYSITTRTVILASGGGGRIYSRTDNPARTTGDGYALAFELGLPLLDMEFVQFYPMGFAEPGFPVWMIGLDWLDHARLTNSDGDEFLRRRWPEWGITSGQEANLFTRDRSSIAIESEWRAGREAFFHFEEVEDARWKTPHGGMIRKMFPSARPPKMGPVRVRPVQHYFPGGVLVNPDCSTSIDGLFACGEVTGGTDGANRIGGNALSMITVFGFRAAKSALGYIPGAKAGSAAPDTHPADDFLHRWAANTEGTSAREVKKMINRVCDSELGVVRSEAGLKGVVENLARIEESLGAMHARSGVEMMEAYEARNMLTVARIIAHAARRRTESRGVHFREDYPKECSKWLKHLLVRQKNGNIEIEEKSLDLTPTAMREGVPDS